jgi:hypothetical protein
MTEMTRRFPPGPAIVEVVTFGTDHPGAAASGARAFYERLGFTPAEAAAPGPEGGSRQVYRKNHYLPRGTSLELVTSGRADGPTAPDQAAAPHRCSEAILAPSAWDRNFAQVTVGTTVSIPAMVPNPQSVPAITLSRPTTSA